MSELTASQDEAAQDAGPDKVRLGGMALPNGVLVHGPTSWACAIRTKDGGIDVASGRKRPILKLELG